MAYPRLTEQPTALELANLIRTGERSPMAYLLKPLTDYFTRAFRES